MKDTVNDFWWMVWQENTKVIVMTTKEVERMKVRTNCISRQLHVTIRDHSQNKCAKYWPDPDETKECGQIKITTVHEKPSVDYTLREFRVTKAGAGNKSPKCETRTVWHYHFTAWPGN